MNEILVEAARRVELPIVATNDVHFMRREDGEAQLYLECIRQGRSHAEAQGRAPRQLRDVPEEPGGDGGGFRAAIPKRSPTRCALRRCARAWSSSSARRCCRTSRCPNGYSTEELLPARGRRRGSNGASRRCASSARSFDEAKYRERLARELDVIIGMQFPGYFLIVWDFIREAKSRGIPVGPGRGSGAGSLVAYSMGITDLDPMPYNLLFERFLNPERVSMPDFDVDFCMAKRDEVIDYVAEKYGKSSVGQIATYQNLKARSVIKDVARTMGLPAPEAQRIASLVPDQGQGKTATIEQALEHEPKLKAMVDADERVAS